jgi:hypothetical protein
MGETADAATLLVGYWASDGEVPAPSERPEDAVRDLEQRYGVTLPEDFRAYLLNAAPAHNYYDDGDGTWWSPANIKNIPDEYPGAIGDPVVAGKEHACLFFADFLIWASAWAICCAPGSDYGKVVLICSPIRWVADSFTDFVRAYTTDPRSLY